MKLNVVYHVGREQLNQVHSFYDVAFGKVNNISAYDLPYRRLSAREDQLPAIADTESSLSGGRRHTLVSRMQPHVLRRAIEQSYGLQIGMSTDTPTLQTTQLQNGQEVVVAEENLGADTFVAVGRSDGKDFIAEDGIIIWRRGSIGAELRLPENPPVGAGA